MHATWAGPGKLTPHADSSPSKVIAESKIDMLVVRIW